ncbi:MAG: ABC transporter ATP-binding protein [bacterium]|nr:ABC transporter ATP-binding protein [bacterium]
MSQTLLRVEDLHAGYGRIEVLHGIALEVREGELVSIVGANGAGKTTLLLTLSGIVRARRGKATLDGARISGLRPHAIVARGLIHVPEGRLILAQMSIEENMQLGAARAPAAERRAAIDALYARFPVLGERRALPAGSLSGGEQQMLAIARGILARPRLLLLDEPSMGLAPKLVDEIFRIIAEVRAAGTSVLLVEQNARKALALADRGYVLERGRITLSGSGSDLLHQPAVVEAYLGARHT